MIDLEKLELQLKKRLKYPYTWGRKQADDWDKMTNFIYEIRRFSDLEVMISNLSPELKNYALNRWLNFWSAKGIEQIFTSQQNVVANKNEYDKLVDFTINGIPFDHKTSVFPKGFKKDFNYAYQNKRELIQWFYDEQSQQGRKHLKNRLFVVLFDRNSLEYWKLKVEIRFIKQQIEQYITNFSLNKLERFNFENEEILSDVIWIIK
ncbi:hypothetical protein [Capnocytophaga sputigena]|jgi:identified by metaGeneAnnotator|uniref:hypothetical protein n=1 Tax=Capnocytophaga sputigena TaxID=1019 RepID=UPI0028D08871|nr:hypothetical protein [Capnocytophaga sputigena]